METVAFLDGNRQSLLVSENGFDKKAAPWLANLQIRRSSRQDYFILETIFALLPINININSLQIKIRCFHTINAGFSPSPLFLNRARQSHGEMVPYRHFEIVTKGA